MSTGGFLVTLLCLFLHLITCSVFANNTDNVVDGRLTLPITIVVPATTAKSNQFIAYGKHCNDLYRSAGQISARGELELTIICKALHRAGVEPNISFIPVPNYSRAVRMVENGMAHLVSETVWQEDIDKNKVFVTSAIMPVGATMKGLYLPEGHMALKAVNPTVLVPRLRGVSLSTWTLDWRALKQITENTYSVSKVNTMLKVLKSGHADFTFFDFPMGEEPGPSRLNYFTEKPLYLQHF